MIEYFKKWQEVDSVTHVTTPQNPGLRATTQETKDVTRVTTVTSKYTSSREASGAGSSAAGRTDPGIVETLGYRGYVGYASDTTRPFPVTFHPVTRVTQVTGSEAQSHKSRHIDSSLTSQVENSELQSSLRWIESANISIAVLDDGTIRIVAGGSQARQAAAEGFAIYSPKDAYYFVQLAPVERRLFHNLKRTFGGSTEWKERGVK